MRGVGFVCSKKSIKPNTLAQRAPIIGTIFADMLEEGVYPKIDTRYSMHTNSIDTQIDFVLAYDNIVSIRNKHTIPCAHEWGGFDRGVYRKAPVQIMRAFINLVEPYLIEPKIQELLLTNEIRKKSMYALERIARFHLEFESIHPVFTVAEERDVFY